MCSLTAIEVLEEWNAWLWSWQLTKLYAVLLLQTWNRGTEQHYFRIVHSFYKFPLANNIECEISYIPFAAFVFFLVTDALLLSVYLWDDKSLQLLRVCWKGSCHYCCTCSNNFNKRTVCLLYFPACSLNSRPLKISKLKQKMSYPNRGASIYLADPINIGRLCGLVFCGQLLMALYLELLL